jgi:hypothetical protein
MITLTQEERHVLEHATGWLSESPLYRNRFVTSPEGHYGKVIAALIERGLMRIGSRPNALTGGDYLYCATMDGIRALKALPNHPKRTKKQARDLQRLIDANITEAP